MAAIRNCRQARVESGTIETPLGMLVVTWEGANLRGLELAPAGEPDHSLTASSPTGQTVPSWVRQALADYFRDGTLGLDLPVSPLGTDFQRRVWRALRAIPPGTTRTYGDLARELGTSPRAIGGACRANPCLITVPCHRVVARDGLGGFAGARGGERLAVKCWLLRHEGVAVALDAGLAG